jgi:hypothetical protein
VRAGIELVSDAESSWHRHDPCRRIGGKPGWLKAIAIANPLTYSVDALQETMIGGDHGMYPLVLGFGSMAAVLLFLLASAARLYLGLVR